MILILRVIKTITVIVIKSNENKLNVALIDICVWPFCNTNQISCNSNVDELSPRNLVVSPVHVGDISLRFEYHGVFYPLYPKLQKK